jgi:hypothetical protein
MNSKPAHERCSACVKTEAGPTQPDGPVSARLIGQPPHSTILSLWREQVPCFPPLSQSISPAAASS